MTLGYVFWHRPRTGVALSEYEEALRAFHTRLTDAGIPGFLGSWSVRVEPVPWLGGAAGYEDRYLVADFTSLGRLNEAALAARQRSAHDAAARLAGDGTGGVYALVRGDPDPRVSQAWWLRKREGESYDDFIARCDVGAEEALWQRQLTLGPTPEFQLTGRRQRKAVSGGMRVALTPV